MNANEANQNRMKKIDNSMVMTFIKLASMKGHSNKKFKFVSLEAFHEKLPIFQHMVDELGYTIDTNEKAFTYHVYW